MADGFDKALTRIVIGNSNAYRSGDFICIKTPEDRWWVRLAFWLMFQPRPYKDKKYRVKNIDSDTTMTIEENRLNE